MLCLEFEQQLALFILEFFDDRASIENLFHVQSQEPVGRRVKVQYFRPLRVNREYSIFLVLYNQTRGLVNFRLLELQGVNR